jgi:hypothetical protein
MERSRIYKKNYLTTFRRIGSNDEQSFCRLSTFRASTITLHKIGTFEKQYLKAVNIACEINSAITNARHNSTVLQLKRLKLKIQFTILGRQTGMFL